jgi:hypothetical protein
MGFADQVAMFVKNAQEASREVFRESALKMVHEMQALVPVDSGFLRASFVVSNSEAPIANLENPGGTHTWDPSDAEIVIRSTKLGGTLHLGYRANYAPYVHYGANGRPPRPWMSMIAQRWSSIVEETVREMSGRK